MSTTYYGFNQIDLSQLTYEDFRKQALDLPRSMDPNYEGPFSQSSPYADEIGGMNQGSNFMKQILRELYILKGEHLREIKQKLIQFAERIDGEEVIHPKIEFSWKVWKDELMRK